MWIVALLLMAWGAIVIRRQRDELRAMRKRLERLEARVDRREAAVAGIGPPEPAAHPGVPAPPAEAMPPTGPIPSAPAPAVWSPLPAPAPAPSPQPAFDGSRAEELIGSVWLQNVGALLLLLGVFFLILWGYTTGRFGPGVLVAAGVALGIALAWRGDRMARSLPLFGHALIGVGLGTVYLSLYLGHFTLRALSAPVAFASLVLVSIGSVAVGLRYRVQTIATLGVLGAFVPQLMAAWVPLKGFSMSVPGMLGYLAAVNAVVFLLAARAGWSGLDLAALILSAVTWMAQFGRTPWGWGVQAGLSALFVALGLSPLPRLVRSEGTVRGIDLAVIAVAPVCLVAVSWPLLASAPRGSSAAYLAALAVVYLLAALWTDARRAEQDLWRPLTGAAVVFMTAALERALGPDQTPMVWCVEGTLLVWLGMRERGAWLRLCGYTVSALGALWILGAGFSLGGWDRRQLPGLHPAAVRGLVSMLAVFAGAWLLGRGRRHLTAEERFMPQMWAGAGNLLLLAWTGREALHLAHTWQDPAGRGLLAPAPRVPVLSASLVSLAWLAQSFVLIGMSRRSVSRFLRMCGYGVGALGGLVLFAGLSMEDGWSNDQLPILNPSGSITLVGIGLIAGLAVVLAARRDDLGTSERRMPELLTAAASLLMLRWIGLEADHLARSILGVPGARAIRPAGIDPYEVRNALARVPVLAASFTSAGWLLQALALLTLGWMRRSAFLRWAGLGLAGITVLKFLVVDLRSVDVFWRFLTAIVAGAVLLGISYAYQRRARSRSVG